MQPSTLEVLMLAAPGGVVGQPAGTVDPDLFRDIGNRLGLAHASSTSAVLPDSTTANRGRQFGAAIK